MTLVAVFDCMVFVQALANLKGPAHACYQLVRSDRLVLYMSPEVVAEVGDVLNRPKIRRKFPDLTDRAVETFLQDTVSRAVMLSEVPETFGSSVTQKTNVTSTWLLPPRHPISSRGIKTFST